MAELDQKERNYSETIRLANEVLAIDPTNKDAKLWHAAGLLGDKTYQQAGTELSALQKQEPDSIDVNLHVAALDIDEKKYSEAEALYLRFYKPGQKDLRPLEGLIQLYLSQRQADKALKLLDTEIKMAPQSPAVHVLLAAAAVRAGNIDLAIQQYEWVQSNNPKLVQAYVALGDLYRSKGDVNQAISYYRKAKELAPNDARIIADMAYVETTTGQHADAIANLRKQLNITPDDTVAMNNLAYELAESGTDLEQASALAEKAQRKAPGNPGIQDTLSLVYVRRGLNDSAIQILDGLIKKYPDQPEFRYHLGLALMQKGRIGDAKTQFNIALSHNPPKNVADKIKQIMSKMG
ncbi:MAG TPA: tetratricopeptide repeat protein [Bryobacteraceae bacterium]|nr:tetratricopeptide repeat protein [Bryobacteraceae bacterium]